MVDFIKKITKIKFSNFQLLILTICLFGVIFRFSGLSNMIYSHDEAYTSLRAAGYTGSEVIDVIWNGMEIPKDDIQQFLKPSADKNVIDTLSVLARSEPQLSPLYFIFAHYWMRFIGSSPAAMRALSAFLSLFAIPGMYWLCLELFKSRRIALISIALISLSPFSILIAQDARPYSLWASMTLLSSAAFLVAVNKNKQRFWGIYLIFIIIGIYSHLMFALVIIAHGVYLLAIKELRVEGRFTHYLVVSFLAFISFTPWIYQIITHWDRVIERTGWSLNIVFWLKYIQGWALIFASPLIDLYIGQGNIIPYLLRLPMLLLIGYAIYYLVVSLPKQVWTFLLLLIGVTSLPLFLSDLIRGGILSISGRYFVSTNVVIISIVAHLLDNKLVSSKKITQSKWYLITALLIGTQLISVFNILSAETWWIKKHSWIDPQIGHVINQDNHPLLIANGLWPTDLGDILSISFMVDQDVRFKLYREQTTIEWPEGFSNVYWFHQTYLGFIESQSGKEYQATEVVPYFLWRLNQE